MATSPDDQSRPSPQPSFSLSTLAAGIALAIGVGIGLLLNPRDASNPLEVAADAGTVARGTALFDVLEAAPSAEARELAAGVTATPVLTFGTGSGDYCRELEVASPRGATQLLACRRDGDWRLVLASYAPIAASDGVYRP
ncbi:MAG TPA: hypothetical protein VM692_08005, partial [Gammaproteobacteria bacterium]|nr:hypothetical protein [Gammaproteobacteria bacterium]